MPRSLSRRAALGLAAGLALGLALAACGSGSPAPGGGASASGGTRTVKHARGESTVPARASRMVALDTDALDSMVTLGLSPVGATTVSEGALWKNLDAVRNGRVYQVDDNLWMLGIGYTGAGPILDQIRKDLA
ncbi:hypothetical protein ACIG5E_01505 [Kitasatospora sp. NPDC053057]|uniref:hypothetical protein n=1 Tax=Kitasatospora sp. NPDC053057 TaxID=3364062 RepID=UPI0037C8A25E